jgi:hypothetical protein
MGGSRASRAMRLAPVVVVSTDPPGGSIRARVIVFLRAGEPVGMRPIG